MHQLIINISWIAGLIVISLIARNIIKSIGFNGRIKNELKDSLINQKRNEADITNILNDIQALRHTVNENKDIITKVHLKSTYTLK